MKELKGTKTERNLQEAFAGESQARNKYTYYASKARKEGYEQIAALFEETANNEKEHAKLWFKLLHGGEIADTVANLEDIERHHEERYRRLLANIKEGLVFSREGDTVWICRNCGHIVIGKKAPEVCPVCLHKKSFFEIKAQNY